MRRVKDRLLSVCMVALFAGPAFADPFTLYKSAALQLQQVSVSPGDVGLPFWVTDDPVAYGVPMQGVVGYVGLLWDRNADSYAATRIGAAGTAVLNDIQAAGSYTGFFLWVANDDDDPWNVQLYVEAGGLSYVSGFTSLMAGANSALSVDFGTALDFAGLTDIGLEVRGHFVPDGPPSNPDFFHVSVSPVVPAPGALALTMLGMGLVVRRRGRG